MRMNWVSLNQEAQRTSSRHRHGMRVGQMRRQDFLLHHLRLDDATPTMHTLANDRPGRGDAGPVVRFEVV
jgi:hypothetical protein